MLQVSALPPRYGRQSYDESVGAEPNLTYMSASPVPPLLTNLRFVAPAGTDMVKLSEVPAAADRLVFATPFCSELLMVPTLTVLLMVPVAPWLSVTVRVTL